MFTSLFLAVLFSPLPGDFALAANCIRECSALPHVIVLCSSHDADNAGLAQASARVIADEPTTAKKVIVIKDDADKTPKVWIGVRMTPVPAPLAAHIGDRGAMISNVIQDSPADSAGLEQYDVVISFAGCDVDAPQDLAAALEKTDPGHAAKLTVLRKGKSTELQITPAARPTAVAEQKLKYAEPDEGPLADAINMRGLTLRHGPDGRWMLRDLGPMNALPDALKELGEKIEIHVSPDGPAIDEDDDSPAPGSSMNEDEPGAAGPHGQAKVEVRVQVEDNGQSTTIVRGADGKIQVTRHDVNGKESTATYDSPEAFRNSDPQAFRLFRRHDGGGPGPQVFRWNAPSAAGEALRRDYQIDVEKKVKEALERAREARGQAGAQALQRIHHPPAGDRTRESRRVEIRNRDEAGQGANEKLLVRAHDDGSLTIIVAKDGGTTTHEFKSRDAFKAAEPELYEQVKELLEHD